MRQQSFNLREKPHVKLQIRLMTKVKVVAWPLHKDQFA